MLEITNLHATVAGKPILKGLSLAVKAGEVHAIMGPNGAGKSTLGYVLGGRPGYEVTEGSVMYTPAMCSGEGRSAETQAPGVDDQGSGRQRVERGEPRLRFRGFQPVAELQCAAQVRHDLFEQGPLPRPEGVGAVRSVQADGQHACGAQGRHRPDHVPQAEPPTEIAVELATEELAVRHQHLAADQDPGPCARAR